MAGMSASGGPVNGQADAVVVELRNIDRGLNDVKVSIAKLEAGQSAMTQRMDGYERQTERLAEAVKDFDRFRQGAGVKLGAGAWAASLIATVIVTTLVGLLVASLSKPAQVHDRGRDDRAPREPMASPP